MSRYVTGLPAVLFLAIGMLFSSSAPLAAQESGEPGPTQTVTLQEAISPQSSPPAATSRSPAILPLYVTFGVMQALDAHSTLAALNRGSVEKNPILGRTIGSPVAMVALKAGATAGIILLSEKVRRHNRVAALVTMVVLNSAYAVVVAHNYKNAR